MSQIANQKPLQELMTLREASIWASSYVGRNITPSNIAYLVQYDRISKRGENGSIFVSRSDLKDYYNARLEARTSQWRKQLGNDLNWDLSFSQYKEAETTKHVHRLHPYKGKFIPQLVEYFLDMHTDQFKREVLFQPGDAVLDPFCGSGTTLVQACESGLHGVGIDVSAFNAFISNAKLGTYDMTELHTASHDITSKLRAFQQRTNNMLFENHLLNELKACNARFFPAPEFKRKVRQSIIDEKTYGREKADLFLTIYSRLVNEYKIQLKQDKAASFLDIWFIQAVRDEIDFVFDYIKSIGNANTRAILSLILSRTIRSCRATTHADLGTLKTPMTTTYYCRKHGKICKPLFSLLSWWKRYAQDTIHRLHLFSLRKTQTNQYCLTGDSRYIDIVRDLKKNKHPLAALVERDKFAGIFSSPPYVGLIDYHEQHAYAYDLFAFDRNDELEIGPLSKGQGKTAREQYAQGISIILNNCKPYLKPDYNVLLVANDKYNLYPTIAANANMVIVEQYKRPVLNRMEKDRSAYAEIIFHLKEK